MINVMCSGRGTHKRERITFTGGASGVEVPVTINAQRQAARPDGGRTFRFRCRVCGRDLQLREERWVELTDALKAAGVPYLDISAVPS